MAHRGTFLILHSSVQSNYIEVAQGGVHSAVEQQTIDCECVAYLGAFFFMFSVANNSFS